MRKTQRLDKVLAHMGFGSRSELRRLIKQGTVAVNGFKVTDFGLQVDPYVDLIHVNGELVVYKQFIYLMLNKPPGVISATEDNRDRTVIDLLEPAYKVFEPFPVGRLDKDTEGLLLITNDGKLSHELLSPRKHVPKMYFAEVQGNVDERDAEAFQQGVSLDDGYVTMPAKLAILSVSGEGDEIRSKIELTIMEGKFHQVKRMFEAVGKKVLYLKRMSMGALLLDEHLLPGQYRELTSQELESLTPVLKDEG